MKIVSAVSLSLLLFFGQAAVPSAQTIPAPLIQRVEQLARQGVDLQKQGKHEEAIAAFLEAYQLLPVSSLLYNIARTYDSMGRIDLATEYYKKYIISDRPNPTLLAKATQRLKELDRELERQRLATRVAEETIPSVEEYHLDERIPPPGPGLAGSSERPSTPPPQPSSSSASSPRRSPPAAGAAQPSGRPLLGWLLLGGGSLLALTGVGFGVSAWSQHADFQDSRALGEKEQLKDSGQSRALTADLLLGAGAAVAAAGGIWLLLSTGSSGQPAHAGRAELPIGGIALHPWPLGLSLSWEPRREADR
ncbi:MAG: tetratricopeptide repeat protein [Deltaproteobacteria bacterium]|nr:tetratricopeptide repeat protein [Deltaproteobacteria bacterium]